MVLWEAKERPWLESLGTELRLDKDKGLGRVSTLRLDKALFVVNVAWKSRETGGVVEDVSLDLPEVDGLSYDVSKFLAGEVERSERKKATIKPGENASR